MIDKIPFKIDFFVKEIWVRNIKGNHKGMVVGHTEYPGHDGWPIIQYENGWIMSADPQNLVKGHYEKKWVDES